MLLSIIYHSLAAAPYRSKYTKYFDMFQIFWDFFLFCANSLMIDGAKVHKKSTQNSFFFDFFLIVSKC